MGKNLLEKSILNDDLNATLFNMGAAWVLGNAATIISNSLFHFNLNQYNSVSHFIGGVGIGTYTYRKAGSGVKGILAGLAAATMINVAWEYAENKYVFRSNPFTDEQATIDVVSDIAVVYAGTFLSSLYEKLKEGINLREKYPNRKDKWVL